MGNQSKRAAQSGDPKSRVHFVTCGPGLEALLQEELSGLRVGRLERQVGGARFEGRAQDAWAANLCSRTATRVLERLVRFPAPDADRLYDGIQEVDWTKWLKPGGTLSVAARSRESELEHTQFVAQRTKDAVVDALREARGERPNVDRDDPDLRLDVHLFRDRATLSIDTSGEPLFKRGWREHQGRAPLSETMAAAAVLLSGWDRRSPLVDPFCGSGTILIEAAAIATGRVPGAFGREYAFERWPDHDARAFAALKAKVFAKAKPAGKLRLVGYDVDAERVAAARANVAAAGFEDVITIEQRAAKDLNLRSGWNAWIVTNPPWGERVGEGDALVGLYQDFGAYCREHLAGYSLSVLSGNNQLTKALGLKADRRVAMEHGGIEVELVNFSLH